jgi:hypothetical protein
MQLNFIRNTEKSQCVFEGVFEGMFDSSCSIQSELRRKTLKKVTQSNSLIQLHSLFVAWAKVSILRINHTTEHITNELLKIKFF